MKCRRTLGERKDKESAPASQYFEARFCLKFKQNLRLFRMVRMAAGYLRPYFLANDFGSLERTSSYDCLT
jgi:hypothetical protein